MDVRKNEKTTTNEASKASGGRKITTSSTAEYFSKNLQQVGFSSPTKAVLTTVKEALDNSLDACEDHRILPVVSIKIEKLGAGATKNSDKLRISVEDNGPGITPDDLPKVFGEYLASSKFGRGRCSRGQQGIGISAATTWALQTTAIPIRVTSKTKDAKKATSCQIEIDLKNNKGLMREKNSFEWANKAHGTRVEFTMEGRIQLNGEAGLLSYLRGNMLVNPHLELSYELPEVDRISYPRVSNEMPMIPEPTEPHPHTMKLGEFISHARLYGRMRLHTWLKTGFSRLSDKVVSDIWKTHKLSQSFLDKGLESLNDDALRSIYTAIQATQLMAPSTQSVISIGEDALSLSVERLGDIDFFSVSTRKPMICDFKPVQVEVAIARLQGLPDNDEPIQVLRFANRVPLQFDKSACAIVKAITSVNWKSYGLRQAKDSLPTGPYIFAVSLVSPFIKFKNASKETIDASDELVEELRRTLMQAGQRLSRHLSREHKAADLEEKILHLEKFGPVLVDTLCRIAKANEKRKESAYNGLKKILGRDTESAKSMLESAVTRLDEEIDARRKRLKLFRDEDERPNSELTAELEESNEPENLVPDSAPTDASSKKNTKKSQSIAEVVKPSKKNKSESQKKPANKK